MNYVHFKIKAKDLKIVKRKYIIGIPGLCPRIKRLRVDSLRKKVTSTAQFNPFPNKPGFYVSAV